MMYLVEKAFINKENKKLYEEGTIYTTDKKERAEELRNGGFLGVELVVKEELPNEEDKESIKEPSEEETAKEELKDKKKNSK